MPTASPLGKKVAEPIPTQRSFIDTNLLVYADSDDEPVKQRQAA